MSALRFLASTAVALASLSVPLKAAPFTPAQTQVEITLAAGFDPVPLQVGLTPDAGALDFAAMTAVSDRSWVVPSIDPATGQLRLTFQGVSSLVVSSTATVTLTHGADVRTVFVHGSLAPLSIVTLLDDPGRSRTYGLHRPGSTRGSVVALEPITGQRLGSMTVGRRPTDLALSVDGTELLVLNAVDKTVSVLEAATLRLKETISLPLYDDWDPTLTTGDIVAGAGSLIYYTDGAWAPTLRVLDRASGTVIQTVQVPPSGDGFGDFALSHDRTRLYAWAQYGWTAGSAASYFASFAVDAGGLLTPLVTTPASYPAPPVRDPLDTPVLISADDAKIFIKPLQVTKDVLSVPQQSFPSDVYAITPGGEVAATTGALYETATGLKLADVPGSAGAQAITSDYARLVYFHGATRQIRTLDLPATIGLAVMGRTLTPADGAIVLPPPVLQWSPLAGVDLYRVYLGTSRDAVLNATPGSPENLGEAIGASFTLTSALVAGTTYFWRVDPVTAGEATPGPLSQFTVSALSTDRTRIDTATVRGHSDHRVPVVLGSAEPIAWTGAATQPWVRFEPPAGTSPGPLTVVLDASQLAPGVHTASISLNGASGTLVTLPVSLRVDPLNVTHLKSDRTGSTVFAISEQDMGRPEIEGRAYLVELDAATETINRVIPVGWSVTDLAIHYEENRIYIPNWIIGRLIAYDKTTLQPVRSYPFRPFVGIGSGDKDVFRVSAGAAGRLVVEEMDQWIDVDLIDTATGTSLASAPWPTREGGGGFDPTGRYYYHGDSNSSGATIQKYDVLGDAFTELADVRPENLLSGYGNRTVVVSESGNGVFWSGSYFDADLVEKWSVGKVVYSASADSRYAFAETEIFDTLLRRQVLAMPVETRVSAFNTATGKLVVPTAAGFGFYALTSPPTLAAPVIATADPLSATSVRLVWTERTLEMGFELQRRVEGASAWQNHPAPLAANTRTVNVTGLAPATRHEFRLRAVADTVSSDWSPVAAATTPAAPPATPVIGVAAVQSQRIELTLATGGVVDEIVVERQTRPSSLWVPLATLPGTATLFNDTTVSPQTIYSYRVKSVKAGLSSAWATVNDLLTPALVVPPAAPPFILASATASTRVAIYWTASDRADGYIVERLGDPGQWLEAGRTGAAVTTFTDQGLHPRTSYLYRVRAFNDGGSSAPSLTALVTTPSQWVEWRVLHFGSPSSEGPAASLATADDGITNLVRFAFNLPPTGPAPALTPETEAGLPRIWLHPPSGCLRVEYLRRRAELEPGVGYLVEFGDSTGSFEPAGAPVSVEPVDDTFERVVWEDALGLSDRPARFARVRVVEQP